MANIESKRVENMSTLETPLTGRIELVDLDKVAPVPVCFVRQLRYKFPPPHITDGFAAGWSRRLSSCVSPNCRRSDNTRTYGQEDASAHQWDNT
jgi:hypothetical protein